MKISLKRAYEEPDPADGIRILVDRLWPRGLTKDGAAIDHWAKDVAPSNELRRWFGHDPSRWAEFRNRYRDELDGRPEAVRALVDRIGTGPATLVYSKKDERHNNALVLKEYLEERYP